MFSKSNGFSGWFFWLLGGVIVLSLMGVGCSPKKTGRKAFTPAQKKEITRIVKELRNRDLLFFQLLLKSTDAKLHSAKLCQFPQVYEPMRQHLINILKNRASCNEETQESAEGLSTSEDDETPAEEGILTPEGMEQIADTIASNDSESKAGGEDSPAENLNEEDEKALEAALIEAIEEIEAKIEASTPEVEGVGEEDSSQDGEETPQTTVATDTDVVEQVQESVSVEGVENPQDGESSQTAATEEEPLTAPANDPSSEGTPASSEEDDISEDPEILAEIQQALDAAAAAEETEEADSSANPPEILFGDTQEVVPPTGSANLPNNPPEILFGDTQEVVPPTGSANLPNNPPEILFGDTQEVVPPTTSTAPTSDDLSENENPLPPVAGEPQPAPTPVLPFNSETSETINDEEIEQNPGPAVAEDVLPSEEGEPVSYDLTTSEGALPLSTSSDEDTSPPTVQLHLTAAHLMDYAEELGADDAEERLKTFLTNPN